MHCSQVALRTAADLTASEKRIIAEQLKEWTNIKYNSTSRSKRLFVTKYIQVKEINIKAIYIKNVYKFSRLLQNVFTTLHLGRGKIFWNLAYEKLAFYHPSVP